MTTPYEKNGNYKEETGYCNTCVWFDENTHFCRLNPPIPVIFYDEETGQGKTTSKYPVITKPNLDYCSFYEEK